MYAQQTHIPPVVAPNLISLVRAQMRTRDATQISSRAEESGTGVDGEKVACAMADLCLHLGSRLPAVWDDVPRVKQQFDVLCNRVVVGGLGDGADAASVTFLSDVRGALFPQLPPVSA